MIVIGGDKRSQYSNIVLGYKTTPLVSGLYLTQEHISAFEMIPKYRDSTPFTFRYYISTFMTSKPMMICFQGVPGDQFFMWLNFAVFCLMCDKKMNYLLSLRRHPKSHFLTVRQKRTAKVVRYNYNSKVTANIVSENQFVSFWKLTLWLLKNSVLLSLSRS